MINSNDLVPKLVPARASDVRVPARYGMPFGHPLIKAILGSVGVGLLCGLLVYAAVRLAWPTIAVQEFTNIIGLAAVIGAGIAGAIARRRAAAESKQADDAPKK